MTDMIPMQKLLDAAAKEYPSLTKDELTALIGLQIEARQQQVKDEMKRARIGKAKGGDINGQMELFEDGGLKQEGGTVDPVSGNDVPPGSTQEEVRDDIPAQLSEGEFVFPADVVRYIGLEKLMRMRQEAKQGLKMMEEMGQMGNSEEATMPDDLPFDETDLDIEDEEEYNSEDKEMAQGGVVYAANGFAGTTTSTNELGSRPSSFGNTTTRVQPKTYTPPPIPPAAPVGGFKYGSVTDTPQSKLTFGNLFKNIGAADEYRTYVNDAGATIQVPFKNGKMLTGYVLPEGYKPKTEDVQTAKTQSTGIKTTRVEPESGDGPPSDDTVGATVSVGGRDFGLGYNFDGSVTLTDSKTGEKGTFSKDSQITQDIKSMTLGQVVDIMSLTPTGIMAKTVDVLGSKLGINVPGKNKVKDVKQKAKEAKERLDNTFSGIGVDPSTGMTLSDQQKIQQGLTGPVNRAEMERLAEAVRDKETQQAIEAASAGLGGPQGIGAGAMGTAAGSFGEDPNQGGQSDDNASSGGSQSGDTGLGSESYSTAVGGLIPKKKPKIKKMKRGGLASKK